jgi:predicted PurR-regulated permease PerM
MKNQKYRDYFAIGLTAFLVIAAGLLACFVLFNFEKLWTQIKGIINILMPFIIGCVIAYLLAPIYNMILRNLEDWLTKKKLPADTAHSLSVGAATALSILGSLCVLAGLVALVVPSFVTSLTSLLNSAQAYLDKATNWINDFFADNPNMADSVEYYLNAGSSQLISWLTDTLMPMLEQITGSMKSGMGSVFDIVLSGMLVVFKVAKNLVLGFIVAAYLLVGKTEMIGRSKQIIYGVFKLDTANRIIHQFRYIHQVFGGFIRGKLMDSLIIGILCFVGTSLLRIPYAMLVSVLVGVTNIIPFFGPFIGAVPCALLILLNDPVKCGTFIIFIIALQQFDGNILGPKILGGTTGVSSFGVLFAILIFGGLFGFVGMIIGVPVFAVLSSLAKSFLDSRLEKKHMSSKIEDYINLEQVEEKGDGIRVYAKMRDPTKKD